MSTVTESIESRGPRSRRCAATMPRSTDEAVRQLLGLATYAFIPDRQEERQMTTTEQSVKDPVCGMMIKPSEAAATVEHKGKTYYFCSQDCASSFKDDPDTYAA